MIMHDENEEDSPAEHRDAWHLNLAYGLGRVTQKVSTKMMIAKHSFREGFNQDLDQPAKIKLLKTLPETPEEQLSPLLKEMKSIADISGLTDAIAEMDAISQEQSSHPVVSGLIAKIKGMSPSEQEMLSRKFIENLSTNAYFSNAQRSFASGVKMTEADSQAMADAFMSCFQNSLADMGVAQDELAVLTKITDELSRPLNELVQFYVHPKTFSQKMKRLWRLQRIFIKVIKLVHQANTLGEQIVQSNRPVFTIDVGSSQQASSHLPVV